MREKILTPSYYYLKRYFWPNIFFKLKSLGNLITVNYCLVFHTVDKEILQFFVKPTNQVCIYLINEKYFFQRA